MKDLCFYDTLGESRDAPINSLWYPFEIVKCLKETNMMCGKRRRFLWVFLLLLLCLTFLKSWGKDHGLGKKSVFERKLFCPTKFLIIFDIVYHNLLLMLLV